MDRRPSRHSNENLMDWLETAGPEDADLKWERLEDAK